MAMVTFIRLISVRTCCRVKIYMYRLTHTFLVSIRKKKVIHLSVFHFLLYSTTGIIFIIGSIVSRWKSTFNEIKYGRKLIITPEEMTRFLQLNSKRWYSHFDFDIIIDSLLYFSILVSPTIFRSVQLTFPKGAYLYSLYILYRWAVIMLT